MNKKLRISLLATCLASTLWATDSANNTLVESLSTITKGAPVRVVERIPIEGFDAMDLVLVEDVRRGELFPVYSSKDGKYFIGFSPLYNFGEKGNSVVDLKIKTLSAKNAAAKKGKAKEVLLSLSPDSFIELKSIAPDAKTMIVATDPECPYCAKELERIEQRLLTHNIRLVFTPVKGKNAIIKSALIMRDFKTATTTEEQIAVLRKYFGGYELTEQDRAIDSSFVEENSRKVFSSGAVQGVPFMVEL
jgi:thiol:disulfide interchange protein DsbC